MISTKKSIKKWQSYLQNHTAKILIIFIRFCLLFLEAGCLLFYLLLSIVIQDLKKQKNKFRNMIKTFMLWFT